MGRRRQKARRLETALISIVRLDFDSANRKHLSNRGVDDNFIAEILLDRPRFALDPPSPSRSATHLMIGDSVQRGLWTVALVATDRTTGIWRPITAFPSEAKEIAFWRRRS